MGAVKRISETYTCPPLRDHFLGRDNTTARRDLTIAIRSRRSELRTDSFVVSQTPLALSVQQVLTAACYDFLLPSYVASTRGPLNPAPPRRSLLLEHYRARY